MEVFRRLPPPTRRSACALTIGTFDGVHRGHQAVIETLKTRARARGLATCVLTFEPHPREFFARRAGDPARAPARIQATRDKIDALANLGIDRVCIARFDARLARLEADDFFATIIVDGLQARELQVGDDFRFGHQRRGDFALLESLCRAHGIGCSRAESFEFDGARVSSSALRSALAEGDFTLARKLLGRAFTLSGHVIHGRSLGRTLGFPTLNLRIAFARPALTGIFVVRVHGIGGQPLNGVASLGTRPAVEAGGRLLLEAHLFDFSDQVYGRIVRVEFLHKLRDEQHYPSLELLRAQIERDAVQARAWHAAHPFQEAALPRDRYA